MPPPYIGRCSRAQRVHLEQRAQAADSRRLDVHDPRGQRGRADVLRAADRRVVGHALEMIAEPLPYLGQVVRVFEVGVWDAASTWSYSALSASGSSTSKPYWPLKSIVSTAPVAATSSTSSGGQVASASSLKRTPGERASRRRTGSIDGSLPRPSELTKRTGCGSSPSTSCSERPAWRSARSSAADSNAQLRKRSAPSHSGGSGHSSSVAR